MHPQAQARGPKPIALEDYPKFKRITAATISADGKWMHYTVTQNEGADEAHHLGRRENQKDFQVRMRQFFDHYLKETPAPVWMTEGVPQLRKGLDPTIVAPPTTKKTIK